MPLYGMVIITEVHVSEAFAPVYRMAWIIFGITLFLLAAGIIITSRFSRLVNISLKRLITGTQEIGKGNLDYEIPITSKDEIGQLSRAFEKMARVLKATTVSRDVLARSEQSLVTAQQIARMGNWERDLVTGRSYWSREMFRLTGLDPSAGIPDFQTFLEFIHPDDRHYVLGQDTRVANTGRSLTFEFRSNPDRGPVRHFLSVVEPVKDENGKTTGLKGILHDITELKKAEEEIKNLNRELEIRVVQRTAQLEATNRELEAFVYSVSHDLKAPLRSITGFSQALLEDYKDRLDEMGKDYLQRIYNNARRMDELITDLLTLSRVTRHEVQERDIDLSALVRKILTDLSPTHNSKNAELIIQDGISVRSDPHLLEIMLTNLLDNALKFTGKKPYPRIEFGSFREDNKTVYYIRDNGAGFDMAYVDRLFAPFQRLHSAEEFPGTGIGLAIVQRVINRLGGRVWAEGEVDKGATFYFTLG